MTTDAPRQLDLIAILLGRWRTVALCVVLGCAGGVAYALLAPEWYAARLAVVPARAGQDPAAALAAKLPVSLDTTGGDVDRIRAVLTSDSVAYEVVDKFKLQERYGTKHREHARDALWEHCSTSIDRRSGVVTLACEDRDPEIATQITSYFGEVGNRVFARVTASSAREERKFLEAQMTKARTEVDEASRKLREFQEQHKVIDLPEQSKAVISAIATMQGELLSKQLELSYVSSFASRTESSVVQLRQQVAILQSKLAQLEAAKPAAADAGSASASFFPGAMNVPALRYQLEQLMREEKIQETVFGLMTQRYEMARIDEARDTSAFQILDSPVKPTYRSRPKRRQIVAFGALAGLAFAVALTIVPVWWRRRDKLLSAS